MDKIERETWFRNFAELLFGEMLGDDLYIDVSSEWNSDYDPTDEHYQQYINLIAKRTFDLACQIIQNLNGGYTSVAEMPDIDPYRFQLDYPLD
jgi:hypothetical protein